MTKYKMDQDKLLQFVSFSSALDPNFWHNLSKLKLDVFGLDDKERVIVAQYSNANAVGIPCQINLDYAAFDNTVTIRKTSYTAHGLLKNYNTIDEFKNCNKSLLLEEQGKLLWNHICNQDAMKKPSLLTPFYLITFADLKKYHYYYWFAFPALKESQSTLLLKPVVQIGSRFSQEKISSLIESYDMFAKEYNENGFFLLVEQQHKVSVHALMEFDSLKQLPDSKILFGFCDPSTLEHYPGWPLRNFLTLIAFHWASHFNGTIEVLCLRERYKDGRRSNEHSIVLNLSVQPISQLIECPKCVGWEKNDKQKLGPRIVNLSSTMDPARLAESAVDLNLKLMRWRLLPQLDLESISSCRCLLLGAGTLGCNTARCLLGWGVRNITLVDNSKVSYSNPVRQSLFTFQDSLNGGRPKAEAAAEALQKIFPGVNAKGISLNIPMPGHPVSDNVLEQTRGEVQLLEQLIQSHDVVFLLMDTRESRWLPSVIAAAKGKIVMNAALGFDTYLVLRHGVRSHDVLPDDVAMDTGNSGGASYLSSVISGCDLGCYFCNDVVAPGDSTRDRTLDQQCTVSRPGMSYLASALLVELLVSVLTHPQKASAPADTSNRDEHLNQTLLSPLGVVPHQLRGFLSRFHTVMPASRKFDKCTACSHTVIDAYQNEGFEFLLNAFNKPSYLEDLTGLTKLHQESEMSEVWEISDSEEF